MEIKSIINNKRNLGIDALRLIAMFFIVIQHLISHGGLLGTVVPGSVNYGVSYALGVIVYCAVNTFAMISGYVGASTKVRYSRVLSLYFQTVFYCLGITIIFSIFSDDITIKNFIYSILPFSTRQYWYISAYAAMLFLMPLLNVVVNKSSKLSFTIFIIAVFVMYCTLPTLTLQSPYGLSGYSTFWLVILYLIGGYIKRFNITSWFTRKKSILLFFISGCIVWLSQILLARFEPTIFDTQLKSSPLYSYTSPFILLNAVCLVCIFAQTPIKGNKLKDYIKEFAPLSLGVYLIHDNELIRNEFIKGCTISCHDYNPFILILVVLSGGIMILLTCLLIELGRSKLFALIKIDKLYKAIDILLDKPNNQPNEDNHDNTISI